MYIDLLSLIMSFEKHSYATLLSSSLIKKSTGHECNLQRIFPQLVKGIPGH
jgi:hypothetical protein